MEKLLAHRRSGPVAPFRREGGEDGRDIHIALVIRSEDDGGLEAVEVGEAFGSNVGEDSGKGRKEAREEYAAGGTGERAPVPGWEVGGFIGGGRRCGFRGAADFGFVKTESHHSLHALERGQIFQWDVQINLRRLGRRWRAFRDLV